MQSFERLGSALAATLAALPLEAWAALASALVAILSLLLNLRVVRRQTQLQGESLAAALDRDKAAWLEKLLDLFGEAAVLVRDPAPMTERAPRARALAERFSAAADYGRLLFPNVNEASFGAHKLSAFRGERQPILDSVLLGYDLVRSLPELASTDAETLAAFLFDCRRIAVSEVQRSVDPRRRANVISSVTRRPKELEHRYGDVKDLVSRIQALGVANPSR